MSTATQLDTKVKLKQPNLYNVVLLNDDFTPQQFVIDVLVEVFNKSEAQAYDLMMQVHLKGRGVAGTYSREVADQKVFETNSLSKHHKHPLTTKTEIA